MSDELSDIIGDFPYRMALAGGWIDQPFVSRHNPAPPGSMVVVSLQPVTRFMDRSGMATSTRSVALEIWPGGIPAGSPEGLVRELYAAENRGRAEPSGSQDMVGLIYPGISRLDYDASVEGGYFPARVESTQDAQVVDWLEKLVQLVPVAPRPSGYSPLEVQHLEPSWIGRLGQSGKDCYRAILTRNLAALGASFNESMRCWEAILPHTVRHPAITIDLVSIMNHYQARYPGAMYSGCGGGYLYVVSDEPVPGSFRVRIRREGRGDGT